MRSALHLTKTENTEINMEKNEKWIDIVSSAGIILFILIISFVIAYPSFNHSRPMGDGSEYFNNAMRVFNGEIPYKDFWLLFPPGEVLLPCALMKVFGAHMRTLQIFFIVLKTIFSLSTFFIMLRIIGKKSFALLAVLLVLFNSHIWPHHLMTLWSLYFIILYFRSEQEYNIYIASFFIGLAFLFRLYLTGAAFIGLCLGIAVFVLFYKKLKLRDLTRIIGRFISFPILTAFIISIFYIDAWSEMVRQLFYDSLLHGSSMNLPYFWDLREYYHTLRLDGLFYQGMITFFYLSCMYFLPFINIALVIFIFYDRKRGTAKTEKFHLIENDFILILVGFWGCFIFLKSLGRSDISHLQQVILPWLILTVIILSHIRVLFLKRKKLSYFVCILLLSGISFVSLNNIPNYLNKFDLRMPANKNVVSTKYGSFWTDKKRATQINSVINKINQYSREGDYIFVTPWFAPPFYALTNRRNPTYYDSLIDIVSRPSKVKEEQICKAIVEKDTKILIHNNTWGYRAYPENLKYKKSCPNLEKCIKENFQVKEKVAGYWIYFKKKNNLSSID